MANRDISWLFDRKVCKFMRKGEIGDWKNYFTFSQNDFFDALYADKAKGTGLTFLFEPPTEPSTTKTGEEN